MAKIDRFEDIQDWQKARDLVKEIYAVSNNYMFSKDFGLQNQIHHAGVSIVFNIAKGFARKTNKEFTQFLVIAHGSISEVQSVLYVAYNQNYISREQFENLYKMADGTSRTIMEFCYI